MQLSANNQIAIHHITWQIRKVAAGRSTRKNQFSGLSPTSTTIKSWTAFGLVQVGFEKMHDNGIALFGDFANFRIV